MKRRRLRSRAWRWLSRRSPVRRATVGAILTGFTSEGAFVVSGVLAARLLGVTDRGVLALLLLFPAVIVYAGGLGMPPAVTYYVARGGVSLGDLWRVVSRPLVVQVVVLTLLQAAIVGVLAHLNQTVPLSAGAVAVAGVPALLGLQYSLAALQGLKRFKPFNALRLLRAGVYALLVVVLFVGAVADVEAVVAAWVIAAAVPAAIGAVLVRRELRNARSRTSTVSVRLGEVVSFGLRGLVSTASPTETFRIDQAVVGLFLSPYALGLYVVGIAFTNFSRILGLNLGMVAYPTLASQPNLNERRRVSVLFLLIATVLLGTVSLGLVAAAPLLVPMLFGPDFEPATTITRLLLIGGFFWGLRRVLSEIARGLGRPGIGSWAEVVSWLTFLVPVAVLVPLFGLEGVAISFIVSSGASLVVGLWLLVRHFSRGEDDAPWSGRSQEFGVPDEADGGRIPGGQGSHGSVGTPNSSVSRRL